MFAEYKNAGILDLPIETSVVLQHPIVYYRNKINHPQTFESVNDLFDSHGVSFNTLFQQLFQKFTEKKIFALEQLASTPRLSLMVQSSLGAQRFADYALSIRTSSGEVKLLVDYKYIDGDVSISAEEINRAVGLLDDYNLHTGEGSYYLSIIFYKQNRGWDESTLATSARYQIEKTRRDLAGKINYVILSMQNFEQLTQFLQAAIGSLSPYSLIPKIAQNKQTGENKREKELSAADQELASRPKGKRGGDPANNDRQVLATVGPTDRSNWYRVHLLVTSLSDDNPLTGKVTFHFPPSFSPDIYTVVARDGIAEVADLECMKAFSVGVSCDNNTTVLELDLNTLPDLPDGFKGRS